MELKIDNHSIEKSFDNIAFDILTRTALFVNGTEIRFTEIEFYYFQEDYHPDNYTHEHKRKEGEWRFHNQGLDITFHSDDKSDGGILIRGILIGNEYTNGPRNVIGKIFENFNKVTDTNCIILKSAIERPIEIIKTFRHLPNKQVDARFHDKYYRYLVDLKNLKIPEPTKELIKKKSSVL